MMEPGEGQLNQVFLDRQEEIGDLKNLISENQHLELEAHWQLVLLV